METQKGQLTDAELTALKAAIADHYKNEQAKGKETQVEDIKAWAKNEKPKTTK